MASILPSGIARVFESRAMNARMKSLVLGGLMQIAMTAMAITAGMVFSLTTAIFVEELIFGQVLRLFAAHQARLGERR
jgi:hypothetical protein